MTLSSLYSKNILFPIRHLNWNVLIIIKQHCDMHLGSNKWTIIIIVMWLNVSYLFVKNAQRQVLKIGIDFLLFVLLETFCCSLKVVIRHTEKTKVEKSDFLRCSYVRLTSWQKVFRLVQSKKNRFSLRKLKLQFLPFTSFSRLALFFVSLLSAPNLN